MAKESHNSNMRNKYADFLRAGFSPLECARLAGYANPEANYPKVFNHPDIQAVWAEVKQEEENKKMYSKTQAIKDLKDGIEFARIKKDALAIKNCVAELAKLLEFYKPDKIEKPDAPPEKKQRARDMELASEEDLIAQLGSEKAVTADGDDGDT